MALLAALALVVPLSAGADDGGRRRGTFVSPGLLEKGEKEPGKKIHVIIQSENGVSGAVDSLNGLGAELRRRLKSADAIAVDITAGKLASLSKQSGLTITPDATVHLTGSTSNQLWPYASGVAWLWGSSPSSAPQAPAIAVVDSGIASSRADFDGGNRVSAQINLSSMTPNSPGDGRGHGTFVAGIAAGSAAGYSGAAPNAKIVSLDVMDDTGTARTSDVIAACDWILANKSAYNIRVANFSLHSGAKNNFYNDPLDQAVEKLWFAGVFVVAAAGNYGSASGPSGVLYAPGNDPFVMTVGALDLGGSTFRNDDTAAPWSAWGYTEDGFAKPELGAAGRYMVGPVPPTSTLVAERPDHVVAPGYMELSGTSFAAPVVAGTAAQILARHPGWTPDQVKGALMLTAKPLPSAIPGSAGVGGLNAYGAAMLTSAPDGNSALRKFVNSSGSGGDLRFDAASWLAAVSSNASWAAASWADASWSTASWSTASWSTASWAAASWADASWADASWAAASWAAASWADTSQEDGADGEAPGSQPAVSASAINQLQP